MLRSYCTYLRPKQKWQRERKGERGGKEGTYTNAKSGEESGTG